MSGPTLRGIFNRVDTNRDGALDKAEVKKFVQDAGVDSGLFGGSKVDGAVDAFMSTFDPSKTGRVSWDAFASKGQSLIPGTAQNATPADVNRGAEQLVAKADANGDGALTRGELANSMEAQLNQSGVSMAGTKAEIGSKLAMHMLDDNRDGKVSRAEVKSLADDVAAQLAAARTRR